MQDTTSRNRLRRKLRIQAIKKEKNIPLFNISQWIIREYEETQIDERLRHTLHRRTIGDEISRYSLTSPTPWSSPWSGKQLNSYIWRDYESIPFRKQLLLDISKKNQPQSPNFPIDYVYFQDIHVDLVNAALQRQFWPGIDVSENLQYPEFSVVALYKKVVVGCAFMTPNCYITYIMVKPGWEGAGIGRFMLYHLITAAGSKDVTLHVSANNSAMILYQKFGFKPEEFIVGFYDKYLPSDSKECKNAFFIRLRR